MSIKLKLKSGSYGVIDNEGDYMGDIRVNENLRYSFDPSPDYTFGSPILMEIAAAVSKLNEREKLD